MEPEGFGRPVGPEYHPPRGIRSGAETGAGGRRPAPPHDPAGVPLPLRGRGIQMDRIGNPPDVRTVGDLRQRHLRHPRHLAQAPGGGRPDPRADLPARGHRRLAQLDLRPEIRRHIRAGKQSPGGGVRIHAGRDDRPDGFRLPPSAGRSRTTPRIGQRGHYPRGIDHHPRGKDHPRRFGRALVQRHQNSAARRERPLRPGAVHLDGYHRPEKSGGGNPPLERRAGTPGGGTDRAAGGRQQGIGGLRLFRLARSARAVAQHRRVRPGAPGGLRRPPGRSGAGLPAADPLRQQTDGAPDRRPAPAFAADPR